MTPRATRAESDAMQSRNDEGAERIACFEDLRGVAVSGDVFSRPFQPFYSPAYAPEAEHSMTRLIGSTPRSFWLSLC